MHAPQVPGASSEEAASPAGAAAAPSGDDSGTPSSSGRGTGTPGAAAVAVAVVSGEDAFGSAGELLYLDALMKGRQRITHDSQQEQQREQQRAEVAPPARGPMPGRAGAPHAQQPRLLRQAGGRAATRPPRSAPQPRPHPYHLQPKVRGSGGEGLAAGCSPACSGLQQPG